ncbi:MAG TPA: hypothetical protein VFX97_16890 [Pyrinomonadaceae bacterium]|nr:hypothetical protein [Pyrinomonadaceae bacterium]
MDLFDLAAKITVDAKGVDSTLTSTQRKVKSLATEFRQVDAGTKGFGGSLTSLGSTLPAIAGSLTVAASAVGGLAAGLFALIKHAADAGDNLYDLSTKTNFSVETLSGLDILAKKTGSSIASLSNSLVIFQSNMVKARDEGSELHSVFQRLKISTEDQEKALRQAVTQLAKMGATETQAAVAKQIFGRAGKDVLAIIKETNGNLDEAIDRFQRMGLIVSTGAAEASNRFNDTLEETTLQLSAVAREIGTQLLPIATDALQRISRNLQENKDQWASWGQTISDTLRGVAIAADSEIGRMIGRLAQFGVEYLSLTGLLLKAANWLGAGSRPPEVGIGASVKLGSKARNADFDDIGRTGGGGGGGRAAKVSAGQQLLNRLTEEYNRLQEKTLELTKVEIVQKELLDKKYQNISASLREQIETLATWIAIDEQEAKASKTWREAAEKQQDALNDAAAEYNEVLRQQADVQSSVTDQIDEYRRQLEALNGGHESNLDSAIKFARKLMIIAEAAGGASKELKALIARLFEAASALDKASADKKSSETWKKAGEAIGFPSTEEWNRVEEERRRRVEGLARDLTSSIDSAIRAGFDRGVKAGVASMLQSLLSMIQNILLKQVEQGLTELLSNIKIGGGGGGKNAGLGSAIGILLGGLGGIFGGGGGGGWGKVGGSIGFPKVPVGFAEGGFMPPNQWAMVGERGPELIRAGNQGASVVPNHALAPSVNITVYAKDAQSFSGRDTQQQITRQMQRVMQAAAVRVS